MVNFKAFVLPVHIVIKSLSFYIIFPYSVQICENTDQQNSEYGHILGSVTLEPTALFIFELLTIITSNQRVNQMPIDGTNLLEQEVSNEDSFKNF